MRDDLHKSAPVGRWWQRYLQSCMSEAERKGVAETCCHRALVEDCHAELSGKFLVEMQRLVNDPQTELLGSKFCGVRSSSDLGGTESVLEEQVLTRVRIAESSGTLNGATLEDAVAGILQDRISNQV